MVGRSAIQAFALMAGAFTTVLTARALGPEARGTLTLLLLVPQFGAVFLGLGLHDAAPYLRRSMGLDAAELLWFSKALLLRVGVPIAVGLLLALRPLLALGGQAAVEPLATAGACALLVTRLWAQLGRGLLIGEGKLEEVMKCDVADLTLAPCLIAGLWLSDGLSYVTAIYATLASTIVTGVWLLSHANAQSSAISPRRKSDVVRLVVRYGSKTQLRTVGSLITQRADYWIVAALLGPAAVGLYSVANTLAEAVLRIPDAVSWVVLPRAAESNEEQSSALLREAMILSITAATCGAVAMFTSAEWLIVSLLGHDYSPSVGVLRILLAAALLSTVYKVLGAFLIAKGGAIHVAIASWVGAACLILLDLLLIPEIGLAGAALAAAASYGAAGAYTWYAFRSRGGSSVLTSPRAFSPAS
jgi:O-antigen/teichoic acid export membrane protein